MRLKLENISKTFNKTVAVDQLDLTIPESTVFGLLGPNGAGKTTTIRMIMNIIQPDSGKILFDGKTLDRNYYHSIGYLPEERGLYQKAKLRETIVHFGTLKGLSKTDSLSRATQLLDRFDLISYADRKIEELSKGNQQKVQFIIAVIHQPELIILDEPFTGLDPVNQMLIKEIISEFRSAGKTIVLSTHQMEQVEKLCNDICMIDCGKRVLYGNLKDIKKEYGNRKFRINYDGDDILLKAIIEKGWEIDNGLIFGDLEKDAVINDVLSKIIAKVTVTHVDIAEPTLEQIFINQVRKRK